jgi:hypothetical protein
MTIRKNGKLKHLHKTINNIALLNKQTMKVLAIVLLRRNNSFFRNATTSGDLSYPLLSPIKNYTIPNFNFPSPSPVLYYILVFI